MRNLKHGLLASLIGVIALSFGACSNRNEVLDPGETGKTRLTFKISTPKNDPVTYTPTHDAEEYQLKSLWLYEFKEDGTYLAHENIAAELETQSGPSYTYTYTITNEEAKVGNTREQFVFVANEASDPGEMSLTDLQNKIAANQLSTKSEDLLSTISSAKLIPMTGKAEIATTSGPSPLIPIGKSEIPTEIKVQLTRIVARIDVENKIPNLEITDLKLSKTNDRSYLFPQSSGEVPGEVQKKDGIAPFAAISTLADGKFDYGTEGKLLKKAFYLYEGKQADKENAVTLEVRGKVGTEPSRVDVYYRIPFWNKDEDAAIDVKRNTLYKITFGDGTTPIVQPDKVSFTISVEEWQQAEFEELFEMISAEYITTFQGTFTDYSQTPAKVNELEVEKDASTGHKFKFTSKYTESPITWKAAYDSDWIQTVAFDNDELTFDIQENTGDERTGKIIVSTSVTNSAHYVLVIKQKKGN